jgi:glycosidase
MFNFINSLTFMKKIYFMVLCAIACSNENTPKPVVIKDPDPDQPVQYGTPFSGVPSAKTAVLYEVNMRAFSTAGNFQGVIDRLDHIKALGINTIWLMPIFPVGQIKSAGGLGSPYAVQNYVKVNPEFGDLAKLRELVQKAHDKNMAVILDWVANHTAWDNPWISNKSWYTQDASGNIIIPAGTNWQDVADLNYGNFDMRDAMIHAMKYWVLEANVDGFRCDAVDFVPTDFWKQALDELKSIKGRQLMFLAEGGKSDNFSAGFQMNYAWDFYSNMKAVYNNSKAATSIFTTHQNEYNQIPAGGVKLRYTTNHDESAWEATPIEVFKGNAGALSASVITIFTSATPLLYGSQEVGQAEKLSFFTRDPINWNENEDMESAYEKLFTLYHQSPAFISGTLEYFANNDVAVFKRKSGSDEYLFLVNVRNNNVNYTVDSSFKSASWTNALSDADFTFSSSLALTPFQYLILKKK